LFSKILQGTFFLLIVRPVIYIWMGLSVRHRRRLPRQGPAIIVANHNSHLDTVVLMSLFPMRKLAYIRPVAAADYWMKTRLLGWFATHIINIIPIERNVSMVRQDIFAPMNEALERGEFLILFPEGSRGEPEQMTEFKSGIAHLARRNPDVPVVPVFLHGVGKALPKGKLLILPIFATLWLAERCIGAVTKSSSWIICC
jgi:1-acyl-sn-glycerol-3-phosphate acyltransferase